MHVGIFIIKKMLLDNVGMRYVCDKTKQFFFAIAPVWGMMLASLKNQPSPYLLKLIILCYSRLSKDRMWVAKFHNLKWS